MPADSVDIYVLGTGIFSTLHFTTETLQALRVCRHAFVLHDDLGVHARIAALGPRVHDMADRYDAGRIRRDIYVEIAAEVVAAASQCDEPVALVVHGHPLFLVSATEYLLELARGRQLTARVLPAVSSFDTLLADLEIDLGYGVQIFDATTLLEHAWMPNPEVPTLLFQLTTTLIGEVVTETESLTIEPLVKHLLLAYPYDHSCLVLHSATHVLDVPGVYATPLGGSRRIRPWSFGGDPRYTFRRLDPFAGCHCIRRSVIAARCTRECGSHTSAS